MPQTGLGAILPSGEEEDLPEGVTVEVKDPHRPDALQTDSKGKVIRIDHGDGSVTVSLDGSPLVEDEDSDDPDRERWYANLADRIPDVELNRIADSLLRLIADDDRSRQEWLETRKTGLQLLGLKIESASSGGTQSGDGGEVAGMSKVMHPLLLEATLRFQANARSELLPTDGPVKIRDDDINPPQTHDELADALEKDFNHYLTVTATEYYPDTDRMLLRYGFGGLGIKKIYFCPLRMRPVSETVDAADLIVNDNATDIQTAKRVTHRIDMKPSTLKRLQILGVYRNIELGVPTPPQPNPVKEEEKQIAGQSATPMNPEDRDYEIYECRCELDIAGLEHKIGGQPSGLEVPYRVTIETSSKKILSIVRNYEKPQDGELPEAEQSFVAYIFVPGFGFYPIGLLHILGNTTNAVTAAWRILLDMGMFSNFPGFLYADQGQRQNTNIFRVPAGGGASIKTGGIDIQKAVMALPYNTQNAPALMQLVESMASTGQRLGGTAEISVGEGRQDAPVGTTVALIEQAAKIMNAVHKRMHASQALELQLLKREFQRHPESLGRCDKRRLPPWNAEVLRQALEDCNLVPQADPNTASHLERMGKTAALAQRADAKPQLYDPIKVEQTVLRSMGWNNPEQFLAPPSAMAKPPPELEALQAEQKTKDITAQARMIEAQARARDVDNKKGLGLADLQLKQGAEQTRSGLAAMKTKAEMAMREREAQSQTDSDLNKERLNLIDIAQNMVVHPEAAHMVEPLVRPAFEDVQRRTQEEFQRRNAGLGIAGD